MPVLRRPHDHEHPYAQISNDVLDDGELSFKAKGLLSYLLARSDDWEIYLSQLTDVGPDGRHAIRSAIQELREAGFLKRSVHRDEEGKFDGYEYIVYERRRDPGITDPDADSGEPGSESPGMGKPVSGKPDTTKKESTNKGSNQSGSGSAGARGDAHAPKTASPSMPGDLLPLYEVYEPTVNEALRQYEPEDADQLVSNQWGQIGVGDPVLRLATETEWPYFVAGVVITANEADSPNPRYLDTLLDALTSLDEHTTENPTEDEQQSNLQRLWNAARTA